MTTHRIPCKLSPAADVEIDGWLTVAADFCPAQPETRTDPGEAESYEVWYCRLDVDAKLRAVVTDTLRVRVEDGRGVEIDVRPGELLGRAWLPLCGELLFHDIEQWLLELRLDFLGGAIDEEAELMQDMIDLTRTPIP